MSSDAELISEIFTAIDKIRNAVQTLANVINDGLSVLSFFLGWIADKVREGWNWFMTQMGKFWDWLTNITSNMGSPSVVSKTADAWSDTVGGPVSQEVENADAGSLLVDDDWTGDAADQYKQTLPLQKAALNEIKTGFTDGIALVLSQLRTAIFVFWAALVVALATLIAGVIAAIASAATVFGLPAAPFIAAAAVGVALASCWLGAENLKSAAASTNTQLREKLNDNSAFPGGHWPSGVLH